MQKKSFPVFGASKLVVFFLCVFALKIKGPTSLEKADEFVLDAASDQNGILVTHIDIILKAHAKLTWQVDSRFN